MRQQHRGARGRRLLAAGLLACLTACSMTPPGGADDAGSGGPAGGGKPVIGVSAIDLTSPFFVGMREAGEKASDDYGVTTTWQSAEGSVERQVSTVQNFVNQRVDAILIDPLDKNALRPAIGRATAAGIPVVTMGNKVQADGNHSTLYRDADNMAMVARATGAELRGKGQVALLVGARGNYVSDLREKAFREALAKHYPGVDLVSVQPTAFDARRASNTTVTWMTTYPDLDLVVCISDPLCLSAKSTATSLKRPDLKIAGHDGEQDMRPLLEDGSMVMDVLTGAGRVGYWNVAVGARLAKGEDLPRDLYLRSYFVTTEDTATRLADRGVSFPHVSPARAAGLSEAYEREFGPDEPASAMTVSTS